MKRRKCTTPRRAKAKVKKKNKRNSIETNDWKSTREVAQYRSDLLCWSLTTGERNEISRCRYKRNYFPKKFH